MTPASRQIAVASFSAPRTTPFEMPGATATSSITDDGWASRDPADACRDVPDSPLGIVSRSALQFNTAAKASAIMIR
jgi:hypothetical protein